jgi:hypothetical protein
MQGDLFIQQETGSLPVYPGHPLVLAAAIMYLYPNLEAALAQVTPGCSAALSDDRVSGAGCHMRAALTCLGMGAAGGTVGEMIDYAQRYWVDEGAGGHVDQVEAGNMQAEKMKPVFQRLIGPWLSA